MRHTQSWQKKSHIRETLNLSTDADSSTNIINFFFFFFSLFFGGSTFFWGASTIQFWVGVNFFLFFFLLNPPLSTVGWLTVGWVQKPQIFEKRKTKSSKQKKEKKHSVIACQYQRYALRLEVSTTSGRECLNCHIHTYRHPDIATL